MQTADLQRIDEEYYQISEAILSSFPKYRPPLDLFLLKEDLGQLQLFIKKDTRITNEQIEQLFAHCKECNLFVSRVDFPIYSKHITKQLDLVLVDRNLKESEVADITLNALGQRVTDFYAQPVKTVYDALFEATQVVTEYIWQDKHRLRLYMRRLSTAEHSFASQALNTFVVGLWLLCKTRGEAVTRREFDRVALALLIHDAGMAKVPSFILSKTKPLRQDEREKILSHPIVGMKIAQKLEIVTEELRGIVVEHQERMDGSGYPQHLKGDGICRLGRLAAVADSFSAMIQKRPHAAAIPLDAAARALANEKTRYDAAFALPLVAAFATNDFSV